MNKIQLILEPEDNSRLQNLCGPLNNNIKEIEQRFNVEINQRGNLFNFVGDKKKYIHSLRGYKRAIYYFRKK